MSPFDQDARTPVIIAARRTPIGRAYGSLAGFELEELAAPVISAVLKDVGVAAYDVSDVILGNATGGGGNIARLSALQAGLGVEVAGVSVDRQCGSGLEAIAMACHLVAAGAGDMYVAGGVESVSRAPLRSRPAKQKGGAAEPYTRARFAPDAIGDPDMGVAAENVAQQFNISRERADALALQSHARAVQAQAAGVFDAEIVPLQGDDGEITADECPRADTNAEKLASLPPVFAENGRVTAGNSCPLNDGAAVVLVTNRARAKTLRCAMGLDFVGSAVAGVDPNILGIGPIPATEKLLCAHPEISLSDARFIEFNEAFASQVLASLDALGVHMERINLDGGALALGHPFGASGAILMTRLFHQFRALGRAAQDGDLALAMMGIGGGMGISSAFRYRNYAA